MKRQEYVVAYPSREKAYSFIAENGTPFLSAVIGITYPYPDYQIADNARTFTVLEYVLEGEGEIFLDGEWRNVQAGDTYVLFRGEKHAYRANPKNPFKKIWINYDAEYICALAAAYGVKSGRYKADTLQYFQKLYALFKEEGQRNIELTIADCVYQIIKAVAASGEEEISFAQKIKSELDACVYKKTDLEEIAQKLFSSKSNVIRIFKAEYGVTPYDYLLTMKISSAKLLLTNSRMSVKEIADRLCIFDEHYFSTLFLKRTGLRPKKYREEFCRK